MIKKEDLIRATLKGHNYSLTNARLIVFKSLTRTTTPVTMTELIKSIGKDIDRASIYRTVAIFEKLGIVNRIYNGWKYKLELSDDYQEHHHHFTCTSCGKMVTINSKDIEDAIHLLQSKYPLVITSHQLEVQGLCQKCIAKV